MVYEKQTVFTAIKYNSSVNESFSNTFNKPKKLKIEHRDFDLRDDCQIDVLEAKKPKDQCNNCDARFYSKQSLNNHIKFVHEGKKPFKCNVCDASFSYKNHLNGHIESVHERKKPFKCSICDYRSSQKNNMKLHISRVHDGKKVHNGNKFIKE